MRISDWSSDVCSSDLAGVAKRDLRLAARGVAAGDGDLVDDRSRIARIDRRRTAAHHFHAVAHQVVLDKGVTAPEVAVVVLEQGDAILLKRHEAPVAGKAAQTVDVLDLRSEEHTSELQSLMRNPYAG